MNTVIISGRLGADPETRTTAGGKTVCGFRMALDSYKRDAPAEWVSVSAWDKTAEFVQQYLAKGRKVLVEGRLQVREWEDRESGKKRSAVEVVANRVEFMDSNPAGREGQAGGSEGGQRQAPAAGGQRRPPPGDEGPGYFDSDVPF